MMYSDSYYIKKLKKHTEKSKQLKRKLNFLSTIRLLVFLATIAAIYFAFNTPKLPVIIGVIGVSVFLWLLKTYTNVKQEYNLENAFITLNTYEIEIAKGNFYNHDTGEHYLDPKHYYSYDIDVFGKGSFYQFINRTELPEGSQTLANCLLANDIANIESRQNAIKDLAKKPEWRQHYQAIASLINVDTPSQSIVNWLHGYKTSIPSSFKWLPIIFSVLTVVIFTSAFFSLISFKYLLFWVIIGLAITGFFVKKVNALSAKSTRAKDTFRQYAKLLKVIEEENFASSLLKEKQQQIKTKNENASSIFKRFSNLLDALDNRNNVFWALIGNGFFLWDLNQSYKIEQWINQHKHTVEHWFNVITFFDAYNSLGNYAFNHPDYTYPTLLNNSNITIKSEKLGHPLLQPEKRVVSDLHIDNQQFFIVTGANMAGKSTFLRTVSLHIVMANVGLPICATKSEYQPIKLITSMRTSDSLTDDSSYFFSELTRLKFIVDQITKVPYFIILDEILKGTNSTDKAIGSKQFVEKLVAGNATGIIATHDLSLCEIENQLDDVKNYYFDAEIVNNELYFDYKLKKGICQNMNASFLLKKMGIV